MKKSWSAESIILTLKTETGIMYCRRPTEEEQPNCTKLTFPQLVFVGLMDGEEYDILVLEDGSVAIKKR